VATASESVGSPSRVERNAGETYSGWNLGGLSESGLWDEILASKWLLFGLSSKLKRIQESGIMREGSRGVMLRAMYILVEYRSRPSRRLLDSRVHKSPQFYNLLTCSCSSENLVGDSKRGDGTRIDANRGVVLARVVLPEDD